VLKFVVLLVLVAIIAWMIARLIIRRGLLDPGEEPRPFGPDDDPDFLRTLNRDRRED
jgi:hypothetical protein